MHGAGRESASLRAREGKSGWLRARFGCFALFALLGVVFSAVSTYDFVAPSTVKYTPSLLIVPGMVRVMRPNLRVHAVLMSPILGVPQPDLGGIPIALPALACLLFSSFVAWIVSAPRDRSRRTGSSSWRRCSQSPPPSSTSGSEGGAGTVCTVSRASTGRRWGAGPAIWATSGGQAQARAQPVAALLSGRLSGSGPGQLYMVQKPPYPDTLTIRRAAPPRIDTASCSRTKARAACRYRSPRSTVSA